MSQPVLAILEFPVLKCVMQYDISGETTTAVLCENEEYSATDDRSY